MKKPVLIEILFIFGEIVSSVGLTYFLGFLLFQSYWFYLTGINPILWSVVALVLIVGSLLLNLGIIKIVKSKNLRFILRFCLLIGILTAFILIINNGRTFKNKNKLENERSYSGGENDGKGEEVCNLERLQKSLLTVGC